MKKTLITLAALAAVSAAQAASNALYTANDFKDNTDTSVTEAILSLPTTLDNTKDWVIAGEITVGSAYNNWGTPILATGNNPFADSFVGGFQLYVSKGGDLHVKLGNYWDQNKAASVLTGLAAGDTFTFSLQYNTEAFTLKNTNESSAATVKTLLDSGFDELGEQNVFNGYTTSLNAGASMAIAAGSFTMTILQNDVIKAIIANDGAGEFEISQLSTTLGWSGAGTDDLPDASASAFNGNWGVNISSVPEPTTATLSLLALAGLAARRRRK